MDKRFGSFFLKKRSGNIGIDCCVVLHFRRYLYAANPQWPYSQACGVVQSLDFYISIVGVIGNSYQAKFFAFLFQARDGVIFGIVQIRCAELCIDSGAWFKDREMIYDAWPDNRQFDGLCQDIEIFLDAANFQCFYDDGWTSFQSLHCYVAAGAILRIIKHEITIMPIIGAVDCIVSGLSEVRRGQFDIDTDASIGVSCKTIRCFGTNNIQPN